MMFGLLLTKMARLELRSRMPGLSNLLAEIVNICRVRLDLKFVCSADIHGRGIQLQLTGPMKTVSPYLERLLSGRNMVLFRTEHFPPETAAEMTASLY